MARSKTEAAESKVKSAVALGALGGGIAGPIGAGVGAITGLIIGDDTTVFKIDMIAVPAFEYASLRSNINANPSFMVYIKAGETLVPTGGNVLDMKENMSVEAVSQSTGRMKAKAEANKRAATAYNKRYSKFFKQVKGDYRKKGGGWKKNGFKRAVKEAHKLAGMGGKK